jgi:MoxR-like ATPase
VLLLDFSLCCCCCVQALTPQLTENKRKTEELLRESFTLQQCLAQRSAAGILEKLLPKRYKQYQKGISSKV